MCFSRYFFLVVDLKKSMENYLDIHANWMLKEKDIWLWRPLLDWEF